MALFRRDSEPYTTSDGIGYTGFTHSCKECGSYLRKLSSKVPCEIWQEQAETVNIVLAIIGKRRFLDCGRGRSVNNIAELETQVREIAAGRWVFPKFIKDRLEVGQ